MPNSLKSGVLGLRKRLREFSADAKIESHPGFGYRFQDLSLSIS
jgi:signal transduction histidine kinase